MANRKVVRIPAKDLPDVFYLDGVGNAYFARYRIVSEDGRLYSTWSQKFQIHTGIDGESILLNVSEWKTSKNSDVLSATWNVQRLFDNKKLFVNKFHVYVKFGDNSDPGQWVFSQETTATNFSTIIPTGKTQIAIAVIIPTYRGLDVGTILPDAPATLFPESVLFVDNDV